MTRFFIYKVHAGDDVPKHAIVKDPLEFAKRSFDPLTMEFTGVSVEAENELAAHEGFYHPRENVEIFSCDEPLPTAIKRKILNKPDLANLEKRIDDAEKKLLIMSCNALALLVSQRMVELNTAIAELSRTIRKATIDYPHVTNENLYERLKEQYIERFRKLPYDGKS